jgi:hypothetical protein
VAFERDFGGPLGLVGITAAWVSVQEFGPNVVSLDGPDGLPTAELDLSTVSIERLDDGVEHCRAPLGQSQAVTNVVESAITPVATLLSVAIVNATGAAELRLIARPPPAPESGELDAPDAVEL